MRYALCDMPAPEIPPPRIFSQIKATAPRRMVGKKNVACSRIAADSASSLAAPNNIKPY